MSSQIPKNKKEYDVFVCYYEITGKDFATMVHRALTEKGYKVFVAHIERPYMTGNFQNTIDDVIDNCQTFLLLNTLEALTRTEVIREVKQAFPNGKINKDKFWVFRENADDVPWNDSKFQQQTKIDLSKENQPTFNTDSDLARAVLRKCRQKRESALQMVLSKEKTSESVYSDYSEKLAVNFAEQMKKKGFTAEIQKDIGNNFYVDLVLQKDNQIILCEFKKTTKSVNPGALGNLLLYKSELEHIMPKNKIDLWLIAKGNFDSTMRNLAMKYEIQLIDDINLESYIGGDQIYLTTDRSVVVHGGLLKIFTRVDHVVEDSMILNIVDNNGKIIHSKKLEVRDKNWITETIETKGPAWRMPNMEYTITVEYGGRVAKTTVWRTHFGATVELDQKVYVWTDKVYITIVAPDWNLDPNIIDEIMVSISTKTHFLSNYKLIETGPNTGIFSGYVILTGDPDVKGNEGVDGNGTKPTGKKGGTGPTNGLLPASENDIISVSFEYVKGEQITGSSVIRWNIGEIKWLETNYSANSEAILQIVDPDMNLDPTSIDKFDVNIWSDSDPNGIRITMRETGETTGIFQGKVKFITKGKSSGNQLLVCEGDVVTGEYKDRTLPPPYTRSDQLRLTATTFVGTAVPPLERIIMKNPVIEGAKDESLEKIMINQVIMIGAHVSNNQNREQPFAFLVKISNKDGIDVHMSWMKGILSAWQSFKPLLPWIAIEPGSYFVQLFVWQSIDNPNALSSPLQFKIDVSQNDSSVKDISSDYISGILVSIPKGTGTLGCEKMCECFMPSKIIIKPNQTITWFNEDTVSHVLQSGQPFGNETGTYFDSGMIKPGKTFDHKFDTKGVFQYFCVIHPWQVGVIIVK